MPEVKHDLLTNKYTKVLHEREEEMVNGAPHSFAVVTVHDKPSERSILGEVNFQKGAIKEAGVNGVMNEDLIAMVICRLEHFQESKFACYENDLAIVKLEEALLWLRKRTIGRENRGVEGTHIK